MNLYLIRHGETSHNVPGTDPSLDPDPALTDRGRRQVAAAALSLRREGVRPVAIHCGPQRRALETASALRAALAAPVCVDPGICECGGLGQDAGNGRATFESEWPGYHFDDAIRADGWWRGGEADHDAETFHARAQFAIARWIERHASTADTVLVVTHGRFGSALISALLGDPPASHNRYCLDNTGMALIERRVAGTWSFRGSSSDAAEVRLRWCNRLEHLPRDLRP